MASTKTVTNYFPIRWFSLINGQTLNQLFNLFTGSVEDGITATAGGTKALAYQLFATVNRVSVAASAGDSVMLPAKPFIGQMVQLINDGVSNIDVYGNGTDTIDAVATATGVVLSAASRSFYTCTGFSSGAYAWRSQAGAKSS
jgi:hypothetical protein